MINNNEQRQNDEKLELTISRITPSTKFQQKTTTFDHFSNTFNKVRK